jgi:hypothetical protein
MKTKKHETIKTRLDLLAKRFKVKEGAEWNLRINLAQPGYLWAFVEKGADTELKQVARKNFLVNIVTCFEIYFKELLIEHSGKWPKQRCDELLAREKISLSEALTFRQGSKLTPEHLIVFAIPLQNPNAINKVFSTLLGVDFFEAVDKYRVNDQEENFSLNSYLGEWRADFYKLYEIRNAIVHDGFPNKVSLKDTMRIDEISQFLSLFISFYISQQLSTVKRNQKR